MVTWARNGHTPAGKFAPGNRFGKGNPTAIRMREHRMQFLEAIAEGTIPALAKRLQVAALKGDEFAVKVLLDYCLGKPQQAVELTGADGAPLGRTPCRTSTSASCPMTNSSNSGTSPRSSRGGPARPGVTRGTGTVKPKFQRGKPRIFILINNLRQMSSPVSGYILINRSASACNASASVNWSNRVRCGSEVITHAFRQRVPR